MKQQRTERKLRKSCKNFSLYDGHFTLKNNRRVIYENERRRRIIHDVNAAINDNPEATALYAH